MSDKTENDNVIEFIRDSSDIYYVLGAVCGAYHQMNDIAKHEFLDALKQKFNDADNKSAGALNAFINSLEPADNKEG